MADRIGFIGLGIMGSRMAANLAAAGTELTVWNRTTATATEWAELHGARVAASPAKLAEECEVVISMVVDGDQVEAVLLGPEGVAAGAAEGLLCVDMSTISPTQTRRIGAELAPRGIDFVDAPVTGSAPRAEAGTLTIMAGGDKGAVERALPLLEVMGERIVHVGPLGQGAMLKLINNAVAAANAVAVGQALLAAKATGVDLDALEAVLAAGSGGSTMLELKAGPMRDHDYTTLFKLDHMLKDVTLFLEESRAAEVPAPSMSLAAELLLGAARRGHGEDDFAAVIEALEGLAGLRL
jgi:3-hydroxyisobutyrate dehydrogenase-like beta-hydroxyacid dehydrogenase